MKDKEYYKMNQIDRIEMQIMKARQEIFFESFSTCMAVFMVGWALLAMIELNSSKLNLWIAGIAIIMTIICYMLDLKIRAWKNKVTTEIEEEFMVPKRKR